MASIDTRVDRDSGVPIGAQLTDRIRAAVDAGDLEPGERLPSLRELAESAGVNVNTVRTVYSRLEAEGIVRSEHGRGTFVARPGGAASRSELRDQIAALEATLSRLPPPPVADGPPRRPSETGAALLSTDELLGVRDRLLDRLRELDTERTAVLESIERLGVEAGAMRVAPSRRATPSLAGARILWVGA